MVKLIRIRDWRFYLVFLSFWLGQGYGQEIWKMSDSSTPPTSRVDHSFQLNRLHEDSKGEKRGSILLYRDDPGKFDETLVVLPNDLLLFNFNKQNTTNWILVKVIAPNWLEVFRALAPNWEGLNPLSQLKDKTLESNQASALGQITDVLKELYCKPKMDPPKIESADRKELEDLQLDREMAKNWRDEVDLSGKSFVEVFEGNNIYLVSPRTGFVFYELVNLNFQSPRQRRRYEKKNKGRRMQHNCDDILSCRLMRNPKGIKYADLKVIGGTIQLNRSTLIEHGIYPPEDYGGNLPPGVKRIGAAPIILKNLLTCPPKLKNENYNYDSLLLNDVNTFLFQSPNSSSLEDWIIVSGSQCSRCDNRFGEEFEGGIFAAGERINIKVLEAMDYTDLAGTNPKQLARQQEFVNTINRIYDLVERGSLTNKTIDFLAEAGFIYKTPGATILSLEGQDLIYESLIDVKLELKKWENRFLKRGVPPLWGAEEDQVMTLLEYTARGKVFWEKRYWQNPLALLAKICKH